MKTLVVYYLDQKVGELMLDQEGLYSFQYVQSWLEKDSSFELSFSMPLQSEPFGHKKTLAFFENLLPEGDILRDLERSQHIKGAYSFLRNFGEDCAGAFQILPSSTPPQKNLPSDLIEIDLEKIYQAIDDKMPIAELVAENHPGYLSIAGAQDKFPCIYKDHKIYLPRDSTPTTHILKAPIWRHGVRDSVYNEYACMRLASALGLRVAKSFVIEGDHPLYMCERFDRVKDEQNRWTRIHQEDLCQAQGVLSKNKYEEEEGPTLSDNYHFLMKHISIQHRFEALEQFQYWIAFNLLIGNNDSHSKNLSILHITKDQCRLAPFYDLLSTVIYPKLKSTFAFRIGGRNEFSKIGKNQIDMMEQSFQVKQDSFSQKLQEMIGEIEEKSADYFGQLTDQFPKVKVFAKIQNVLEDRIKSLRLQKAIN
ncbi:MAG: type II toxin-antitoxin system HipA family toxin [Bdellovibrionota bacterium]